MGKRLNIDLKFHSSKLLREYLKKNNLKKLFIDQSSWHLGKYEIFYLN